ncbi:outer membrane protein assembly factor BamB family protein [Rhodospirillum rubrum]|uniref:Pyrrolo-quinoline quinone n=1 Tax=Rhodospirillum rubrum (strain ATCC 11170 / ATH 1.1.1 / DSM 467 / LMG 4362 / NCIMB 8255 / S1) TaxID=269796 RepID=Q2RPR5_RHORT|nr:PQQ-binding-like beta-propeller repeat protein [Rhodospirillum rubrum]ABC23880.1 Pyrrolo-quinoline quinone [Rhodospirillum rubrum ATCC 11170]AEO49624.1 Pyrrolo-quinoline quinone [Rhodospirillum rubrum F11]MBK5955556.1 pyrrolo-quinoline quinone [Rhodospirillum rubrum]QXG79826.1 PQQ-binding-like beta-propeller repeat protein [Rhodospirillum rubrum]HAQ00833.1 pyrrolo-quinoline quinone [Rhodospirillum rubrum]
MAADRAMGRRFAALVLSVTFSLALAGCSDTWLGDSWFGSDDTPPLAGERVAVLGQDRGLSEATKDEHGVELPAPEDNDDWPQSGGYSHHAMQHMVVGESLQRLWSTSIGAGGTSRDRLLNGPVLADGRIFTIDREATVRAFNAETGKELWQAALPNRDDDEDDGAFLGGGLAYDRGRIFASTGFAKVVALRADTGQELWRTEVDGPIRAAPAVNSGRVVVLTVDNQAFALSAVDGHKLWSHSGSPQTATILGAPTPAIDQGVVVIPYSSGELFALRLESGTEIWSDAVTAVRRTDATGSLQDIRANPVVDANHLYVIGNSGLMVGMDLRSGARAWQLRVAGTQQPWLAGDVLFLISAEAELAAVNAKTGAVIWTTPLPRYESPDSLATPLLWTGPVLASDRLIIGSSDASAYAVSPYTGKILGRIELPDAMASAPIVAKGTLYFLTTTGELVAYR